MVDRSNEFDLLTSQEWDVYSRLSEAWNGFLALPVLFEGDRSEFAVHINALKNIVMSRPVAKEMVKRDWSGYLNNRAALIIENQIAPHKDITPVE